ncbi:MAG: choice-of-anchor V domain-containing protein [Rhodothermales bacterium]
MFRFLLVVVPMLLVGARAYRTGAPAFSTGAPNEQTCAACHTGNPVNDASGSLVIVAPANYVPGSTVDLVVRAQRAGASRFGFEITALDGANQPVGTFDVSGPGIQLALGSTHHVTHDPAANATGEFEWTVPWEAPASGTGEVTFYAAANAANGDFSNFGDFIFTAMQASSEMSGTHVDGRDAVPGHAWSLQSVWPNPLLDSDLSLRVEALPGTTFDVSIHDIQGRMVWSRAVDQGDGSGARLLAGTRDLAPGAYIVRVGTHGADGPAVQTRTFTKLR